MIELWYALTAIMFAGYVVLDGFDFGAGMLHRLVARTDAERRQVLSAIGPYWDGNEVWLLAGGGTLFLAFPGALASGISGFYFAIFLVLWCLIGRGVAIELRSHVDDALWRTAWDTVFSFSSLLLALFFGVAFGNLVRGVPLDREGWFSLPLFTDFRPAYPPGILDAFTLASGAFAVLALAAHGAAFLSWKTDGAVHERAAGWAGRLGILVALAWPPVTLAAFLVRPELFQSMAARPFAWALVALALVGIVGGFVARARRDERAAFLASCAFLVGILAATAAALYPALLPSIAGAPGPSITAEAAASGSYGMSVALRWWVPAFVIALGYAAVVFRLHRGRVSSGPGDTTY